MPQPKEFRNRMKGRVAIVTGAGSQGEGVGNGKAIAYVLAAEGARVCLVDLKAPLAEETCDWIKSAGGDAFVCPGDISREEDCARIVAQTLERYGKLDTLINNVGISTPTGPLETMDMEIWDRVVNVNLRGTVMMTRHAIGALIAAGQSAIVNISSVAGIRASGSVAYGPTKAGMIALSHDLALMYGRQGVRVNTVSPGHVHTPHAQGAGQLSEEMREMRRRIAPLGIEGDGWDIAAATLFLASDEARFITAVNLPVDGGVTEILPMAGVRLLKN